MKKLLFQIVLLFLSIPFFAAEPTKEQKQAIFMMNYAQYVTYKLKTYNNILALEEEYNNLKDNMNFETIKDYDSVDTINRLMDAIYNERKIHTNRERLEKSVEKRMNNALFNSIPQLTTIVRGGMNPISLAINAARTVGRIFISYQQYKNQLSEEYDQKMFEYQTLTEDILNDIYKDLNTYTFKLMKKYGISDEWRLNETELKDLFTYIKDTNSERAYKNLKNMSSGRYIQHFPMFWYHLAKAAYDAGYEEEALKYYNRFESENIEIFRYDSIAIDAYKGKIAILLKNQTTNKFEILNKLSFIERNKTSWKDYYYCALVYAQMQDMANAIRLLQRNIDELSSIVDNQFLQGDYLSKILNEPAKTSKSQKTAYEAAGLPEYDGLELSRALLKNLGCEKISVSSIENQYKNDTQSVNEILWWFGLNPSSYVIKNSKDQINSILVTTKIFSEKSCQIDVKIPLQWVMSSNTDLIAVFIKDGKTFKFPLRIDEKETKKLNKTNRTPKDTILYYTTGKIDINWRKEKYVFSHLLLNHAVYPVELFYNLDLNRPSKNVQPYAVFFNKTKWRLN